MLAACETPGGDGTDGTGNGSGGYGATGPGTEGEFQNQVGDRVFFALDSSSLSGEAQSTLERQANWLKQYGNFSATIEGHCDERGTREYNLALGERRATAVKNYLVNLGVPASRLSTISYGKERPAVLGSDESAWSQNRRGVTVLSR
ncbi:MAG: peptidoglycan-associated lipoprotein Pal [Rickettsiales bacterium]